MASELLEALEILEKEKDISKESILTAIEESLVTAYKKQYEKKSDDPYLAAEKVVAKVDETTGEFYVFSEKIVAETVVNPMLEVSLENARVIYPACEIGDTVRFAADSQEFSRIATQNAKNVLMQKLRESEKNNVYEEFSAKEKEIVTGTVQRFNDSFITINLGKADGILNKNEQVRSEKLRMNDRIRVYVLEVKFNRKNLKILVSRTHPELVRKLFESEVTEIKDGIVEIKAIAREAGSRTKIAVFSNDTDVDAVGACVGMNGMRVNAVVNELKGEKIDIINWSENPGELIENSLSPAKVVDVFADPDEKTATVIVPDNQLSLAIGKEGQNARLAARLTGYKIDILNETQAAQIRDEVTSGEMEAKEEFVQDETELAEMIESEEDIAIEKAEEVLAEDIAIEKAGEVPAEDIAEESTSEDIMEESLAEDVAEESAAEDQAEEEA